MSNKGKDTYINTETGEFVVKDVLNSLDSSEKDKGVKIIKDFIRTIKQAFEKINIKRKD